MDEIGDISPTVQMRLLRVLEEKVYEPLGSNQSVRTDARVIAATHRNLAELVEQGVFREDLYFRINVIRLFLPTLAEHKEDIPLLVEHFVDHFHRLNGRRIGGVTQEAMAAMMLYDWPRPPNSASTRTPCAGRTKDWESGCLDGVSGSLADGPGNAWRPSFRAVRAG